MRLSKFCDWSWLEKTRDNPPKQLDFDSGHILIYALTDPREGSVRYIGVTSNRGKRMAAHAAARWCGNPGLKRWEDELQSLGLAPKMVTLGIASSWNWSSAEKAWIAFVESNGYLLYNIMEGGKVRDPKGRGNELREARWKRYARRKHVRRKSGRLTGTR
jgi:hypothetical protein